MITITTTLYGLGNTLRNERKRKGLTQGELADMVGASTAYISMIENGQREGNPSLLKSIADKLGYKLLINLEEK